MLNQPYRNKLLNGHQQNLISDNHVWIKFLSFFLLWDYDNFSLIRNIHISRQAILEVCDGLWIVHTKRHHLDHHHQPIIWIIIIIINSSIIVNIIINMIIIIYILTAGCQTKLQCVIQLLFLELGKRVTIDYSTTADITWEYRTMCLFPPLGTSHQISIRTSWINNTVVDQSSCISGTNSAKYICK